MSLYITDIQTILLILNKSSTLYNKLVCFVFSIFYKDLHFHIVTKHMSILKIEY